MDEVESVEVEVKTDYAELVKEAAIRGAVTAIASIVATAAVGFLAGKVVEHRNKKNAPVEPNDTEK